MIAGGTAGLLGPLSCLTGPCDMANDVVALAELRFVEVIEWLAGRF
jgi:hypothetical protein